VDAGRKGDRQSETGGIRLIKTRKREAKRGNEREAGGRKLEYMYKKATGVC